MLRVWTDSQRSGLLDRHGPRGTTFVYDPKVAPVRAVSITMPVRTASWDTSHGLPPIFDMNLPEGALRAYLMRTFAKATGTFDDFDLLGVVGRTQIGRIRYSDPDAALGKFAVHSGLSGVQPKVMIRGINEAQSTTTADRRSQSITSATHIVKFSEPTEYPELAANEFFCLSAAKTLGLIVPEFQLSNNGLALVVKRFDLKSDGSYLGYEDFCVLNGLPATEKYKGGYETRLFKRAREFVDISELKRALEDLFKLFVLNCAIRNGDAHLKNFGIVYTDVTEPATLAPIYDLVSTEPYIPKDVMALTLNGSTNWPDRKRLALLGQTRCDLSLQTVNRVFERTADALSKIAPEVVAYFKNTAAHPDVGDRLLSAWDAGIKHSLGFAAHSIAR
jgi:serine/threonine-protein kinase HipA